MSGQFLTIFEFIIAFILHFSSLVRIGLIFKHKITKKKDMAFFLICLLLNWSIVCILLIPYECYGIIFNFIFYFFTCSYGISCNSCFCIFLTLDRILVITYGFAQRTNKLIIYLYVLIIFIGFGFCATGFMSALNNIPEKTKCEIFGCILGPSVEVYLGWRAICSIFNFSSGILFCILLYKSNKKLTLGGNLQPFPATALVINEQRKKQQSKNNKLTILAIVNEFFLAFIPHFGPFLWEKIFGQGSSMGTGPLSEFMSGLEVFIFVSVFSQVLKSNNSIDIKSTTKNLNKEKSNKQNLRQVRASTIFSIRNSWTGENNLRISIGGEIK
ncbi:hypothetical protein Mgra_00006398 [Meloidogyne graminicola]|uniref:G_PROTEIN_RECEP_F1_2 domain-containing protein n=1 Tax=Meloidogyne graminicola TaxID=189291 RepID=A0A8S9ZLI9_9BILA|nr:hypothetical protein Mgra_00006398 [Meloidogyne graminicola]